MKLTRLNVSGQGLTEYLILLILISLVSIAAVKGLGGTIQKKFADTRKHIASGVAMPHSGVGGLLGGDGGSESPLSGD